MTTLLLTLLLAIPFPGTSRTSWMRPQSFRLIVGMPRGDALHELEASGWKTKPTKDPNQFVVEYGDDKAVTLEFHRERLRSLRFELFTFLPEARKAFDEETRFLRNTLGDPRSTKSKSIVLYDHTLPNIMVVVADDPHSDNGRKGLGILVVRYFDPVAVGGTK
ncbi:MAG: hypothetical protein ABI837_06140 [Acidobacteriota bacterium]